eukprot:scaffold50398_cov87-Phaeocystis_antarctica.AAC.2
MLRTRRAVPASGSYDDPVPLGADAYRVAAKSIQKKASRGVEVQRLAASSGTRKVQQVDDDALGTEADGPRPRGNEEGGRAESADGAVRRRPGPGARRGAAAGACTRSRGSSCRSGSGRRKPKPELARGRAARRDGLEPNGGAGSWPRAGGS